MESGGETVDLPHVAGELALLQTILGSHAHEPEHEIAVGVVGVAEVAAKQG